MIWKTLRHNGIMFIPPFESRGVLIKIKKESYKIDLQQEEMIYQWAKKKDTKYVQDLIFQKNFVRDFINTLHKKFRSMSYSDIDFTHANYIVDKEKRIRESMTKEEKKNMSLKRKKDREEIKKKYGIAIVDGKEVEIANYMMEPPGIFIGRGKHPLRGKWKPRTTSKSVTLNLDKHAIIPKGKWNRIMHDNNSMWIASWKDFITKKMKYVWLSDTSKIKQDMEKTKYNKAAQLSLQINKIKKLLATDMKSNNIMNKKISTVCYLIYRTAMRVGDEKDPNETDTVGATTLRKEHIRLISNKIEFNFLGKDSVRWKKSILIIDSCDKLLYNNLNKLIANKKSNEEIFHGISSRHVNAYYSSIVNGLTAKVFRTYIATKIVKKYLKTYNMKSDPIYVKLYHAKLANLDAAKMCNHKKTVPKTFEKSLQKKRETLENIRKAEPKTKKQEERNNIKKEKLEIAIELLTKTKNYNLVTSLRNYIDPRVYKSWADEVSINWEKIYSKSLQKKFLWVRDTSMK